ncbi:MAG: histidine--tRNA ligase [Proteobacteria bacterium]|nr:histidine--tRNA ligase [Pseudomonadota bacterium]
MSQEHKIYKPKPISGFPEWLPEYRAIELQWMDKLRAVFESYGFCSIETPSVEEVDALLAKGGDTEKEIYTLHRLQADAHEDKEARLALHFDLTVPLARYVAQHYNDLVFPFKRYQIQKSWRGERPQKGRFREFYQCDIDVINLDNLPLHFDAELPAVLFEAYQALHIPPVELHISNRKIVVGYLQGLGVKDVSFVTRELDKLDKLGVEKVTKILADSFGGNSALAKRCIDIVQTKWIEEAFTMLQNHPPSSLNQPSLEFNNLPILGPRANDLCMQGIAELKFVIANLSHLPKGSVIANPGIIRGLDYYTGTVVEVRFKGKPMAIGGGGRYDDLAGSFINQKLPGIGVSIGLTRLFSMLLDDGYIKPGPKSPTQILVVLPEEARRGEAATTANTLRNRGYNVELFHSDSKLKRQLAYAERKGIPYVWFPPFKDGQPHEVKNMLSGKQIHADPEKWAMKGTSR